MKRNIGWIWIALVALLLVPLGCDFSGNLLGESTSNEPQVIATEPPIQLPESQPADEVIPTESLPAQPEVVATPNSGPGTCGSGRRIGGAAAVRRGSVHYAGLFSIAATDQQRWKELYRYRSAIWRLRARPERRLAFSVFLKLHRYTGAGSGRWGGRRGWR